MSINTISTTAHPAIFVLMIYTYQCIQHDEPFDKPFVSSLVSSIRKAPFSPRLLAKLEAIDSVDDLVELLCETHVIPPPLPPSPPLVFLSHSVQTPILSPTVSPMMTLTDVLAGGAELVESGGGFSLNFPKAAVLPVFEYNTLCQYFFSTRSILTTEAPQWFSKPYVEIGHILTTRAGVEKRKRAVGVTRLATRLLSRINIQLDEFVTEICVDGGKTIKYY